MHNVPKTFPFGGVFFCRKRKVFPFFGGPDVDRRNKGVAVCTNTRMIEQKEMEASVLNALAHHCAG